MTPRPPPFQPRTPPGEVWPAVPVPDGTRAWPLYLELARTQWLPPAEIERGQLAQLRSLLAHCAEHVPYYRDLFAAAGIDPAAVRTCDDFRRVPVLTRRTYQDQFARFQAVVLPAGMTKIGVARTSGTTGIPVEVWQTNVVNSWWLAAYLRDAEWGRIRQTDTLAIIKASGKTGPELDALMTGVRLPCWHPGVHKLVETGPAFGMDVHQTADRQLAWLREVDPHYLQSYPSNLVHLAGLVRESGRRLPRLKTVLALAETLTDDDRAAIESAIGVPVWNVYSCFEAGALASPCPAGGGMHVHAENVLLEVLDADGRPCGPGETGRVVLTTLHNFLTPFVRYEIQDEATVGESPCPCGRGLPRLTRVLGRKHPVLTLPDGTKKVSTALMLGVRRTEACHQVQFIHRAAAHMVVRVVPNQSWSADRHPAEIRAAVGAFFASPVRVDVEAYDTLPLPPGGKLRVIVDEWSGR